MNFITNMFSRTTIETKPKLEITTLNTTFNVVDNANEIYNQLLKYSIINCNVVNDYKTTIKLIDNNNNIKYFSTFSKII